MAKFTESKTDRYVPPPETEEKKLLEWWDEAAFDMPGWYEDDYEPSN